MDSPKEGNGTQPVLSTEDHGGTSIAADVPAEDKHTIARGDIEEEYYGRTTTPKRSSSPQQQSLDNETDTNTMEDTENRPGASDSQSTALRIDFNFSQLEAEVDTKAELGDMEHSAG